MLPSKPFVNLSAYEGIQEISNRIERFAGYKAADKVTDDILAGIDLLETMQCLVWDRLFKILCLHA